MKTQQPNKKELQDQMQDWNTQIEKLTKRKTNLQNELAQLFAGLEKQTQAINESVLAGRDTSTEIDHITREKSKVDGLEGAIARAEELLKTLEAQCAENNTTLQLMEIFGANDEVEKQLMICIDKFRDAISSFEETEPLLFNLRAIASKFGVNIDQMDPMQQTMWIYHALRLGIANGDGIVVRLAQIEDRYKNYLKQV